MYTFILSSDAAYRFYRTRCEEQSAAKRGIIDEKQRKKRKHEHLSRVCAQYHSRALALLSLDIAIAIHYT